MPLRQTLTRSPHMGLWPRHFPFNGIIDAFALASLPWNLVVLRPVEAGAS